DTEIYICDCSFSPAITIYSSMLKRANFKYLALTLVVLFFFHWALITNRPKSSYSKAWVPSEPEDLPSIVFGPNKTNVIEEPDRAKACFVVLIRNSDLHSFRASMRQLEDRFNHKYNYPYVFLNDEPFTEEFKQYTSALTKAKTEYGVIPKEHWSVPDHIEMETVNKNMEKMDKDGVLYGGSLSYRHMCRYESGFFFRHELLDKYDYYWRVEPGVQFYCDIDFDPFYPATIPTLWDAVKEFAILHPELIEEDNLMEFISNDNGNSYNLCHFWSNFEIGDLNLWRSEAYRKFFDFLDNKGGFFYERWGDAPVHSIAAALFLKKHQIHFFNEIGYKHEPFMHCPQEEGLLLKCHCDPNNNFDFHGYSCTGSNEMEFAGPSG
ncbi:13988_t:CDS:2, partial [Racocetra persica]